MKSFAQTTIESVGQIPIIGWYGIPPSESTVERFKEQRECGITHNFTSYNNINEVEIALDAAYKGGIKLIIKCPELKDSPEVVVNRFKNHPALAGYCIIDEPNSDLFPSLANLVEKIQSLDKKNFCYVNLLPNYASDEMLGGITYEKYIDTYLEKVRTPFLSFDHYPITKNKLGIYSVRPQWYKNLEIISEKSRKAKKHFWAFALTVAHWNYPIPSLSQIRFQVFSNLAYGCQGIQYFTYWTPAPNELTDFHGGPINNFSKEKTEVYNLIKVVNNEVKNLSPYLLNAKLNSVFHMGNSIPLGTRRLESLPDGIDLLDTNGKGAIVSLFEKDNHSFIVIMNRDFRNKINLRIRGNTPLKRISKDGKVFDIQLREDSLNLDMADIVIYMKGN